MTTSMDFDFGQYVARQRAHGVDGDTGPTYAYGADRTMLRTFRRLRPIDLSAAAIVRSMKTWWNGHYLGTTTRVSAKQFKGLHQMARHCADQLGVPVPTLYVANSPVINAMTFGSDQDACIVVHSAMIDHFTEDELLFVLGHECGHFQNGHVVYLTVLRLIEAGALGLLGAVMLPAVMPLRAWYRRAEITCDRAGLLCGQDLDAATSSFLKLACGSQKLYDEMDVESYLTQMDERSDAVGRFTEMFASHPYTPKRIQALRVFAKSQLYRERTGCGTGGLPMEEVDRQTSRIIQINGSDVDATERSE